MESRRHALSKYHINAILQAFHTFICSIFFSSFPAISFKFETFFLRNISLKILTSSGSYMRAFSVFNSILIVISDHARTFFREILQNLTMSKNPCKIVVRMLISISVFISDFSRRNPRCINHCVVSFGSYLWPKILKKGLKWGQSAVNFIQLIEQWQRVGPRYWGGEGGMCVRFIKR